MADEFVKLYWRSQQEQGAPPDAGAMDLEDTHPLHTPELYANRRDFLKAAGFTLAGAALSSCGRAPVEQAIPFLIQPEGLIPGRSYYQTSTCAGCSAGCGVLVKTRDGRPIKLEGNPRHPISRGGLCAVGQASVLGLYDSLRFTGPRREGMAIEWKDADEAILGELANMRAGGKAVRVLTGTIVSPTLLAAVTGFVKSFPEGRHVTYDALSRSALLDAHELTHGVRAQPRLRLEKAEVIAAFDADFLGTWIDPVQFGAAYRDGRDPEATPTRFSYHAQIESRMSLTGMKADRRVRVAPRQIAAILAHVTARLSGLAGSAPVDAPALTPDLNAVGDDLARRLWAARGRSVVLCGVQDVHTQVLASYANHLLGAYGTTLDLERPSRQSQGSDRDLETLVGEIQGGKVGALLVHGVNPAHELPNGRALADAIRHVPLVISLAERDDETARTARYVCPDSHALEAWGDAEPVAGVFSVQQPAINPIGRTRPAAESFSAWSGTAKSAEDLVREYWEATIFPAQKEIATFPDFWAHALRTGAVEVAVEPLTPQPFNMASLRADATSGAPMAPSSALPSGTFALVLYPKIGMRDGRHAYNAWLQELPDPVSKVTWDNYACLSVATGRSLGIANGDVVRLDAEGAGSMELPAYIQPGQADGVVAVALGYGSVLSSRFDNIGPKWIHARPTLGADGLVGINAAPFLELAGGVLTGTHRAVRLTKTGATRDLASTQGHFRMTAPERMREEFRDLPAAIHETTLATLLHEAQTPAHEEGGEERRPDLWPADHPYPGHRWGMAIDLTSCTGCSACIVGCQAENNTPVVGKDEVRRSREMHWLRLDRYYSGQDDAVDVAVQPMLCQHCENAPCETVCPVAATVHNSEGLNLQVYNRCIGTRFCENNCPYKVRRFNWFEYQRGDQLQNLVLNPDVTVRSRGVMEKCTFCLQRIQEGELEATRRGEPLADGAVQTACQQSCPSRAIVFGDINDPSSRVSALAKGGRHFKVLGELNTKPSIAYLSIVRNREGS